MNRSINSIIIHCSDTPESMDIGVNEIRDWHVNERGWSDVGYHYIIRRDGTIERGRGEYIAGAHCRGKNTNSIGVCLVGRGRFTESQFHSLRELIKDLEIRYEIREIAGHYKYSNKTCPNFNVTGWLKSNE